MNHLLNAVRKCHRVEGYQWAGYLSPKEILAICDIGCKPCHQSSIEVAIDWKRQGICNGRWFYFNANKKFEVLINGIRRHNYPTLGS